MKHYSQSWIYNEHAISRILNKFVVKKEDEKIKIYFEDELITETADINKTLYFQTDGFKKMLLKDTKGFGITPIIISFVFKDGYYEFKLVGDSITILNETYFKFVTLSDSIDNKLALQLNFGLLHKNSGAIIFLKDHCETSSHRWRHGKKTFDIKTENIHSAFNYCDTAINKTIEILEDISTHNISYKEFIKHLTEYDNNGKIKTFLKQKQIFINRKIRQNYNILDDNILNALKTPEKFIESKLDFNISASTLFHNYIECVSNYHVNYICSENSRALNIIYDIIKNKKLNNNVIIEETPHQHVIPDINENLSEVKNLNHFEHIFEEKTGMNFQKFYNNHFNKLSWFLSKYTKDLEKAEEFANEAFVQGLEKIETYSAEKSKIHTWIYKIGENIVRKHYKDDKKLNLISYDNTQSTDVKMINVLPDRINHEEEERSQLIIMKAELIKKTIMELPAKYDKYKTVLIMRELESMQYQDIADKLNINLSTIKSQIAKGRRLIIKKVEKQFVLLEKEFLMEN